MVVIPERIFNFIFWEIIERIFSFFILRKQLLEIS